MTGYYWQIGKVPMRQWRYAMLAATREIAETVNVLRASFSHSRPGETTSPASLPSPLGPSGPLVCPFPQTIDTEKDEELGPECEEA